MYINIEYIQIYVVHISEIWNQILWYARGTNFTKFYIILVTSSIILVYEPGQTNRGFHSLTFPIHSQTKH